MKPWKMKGLKCALFSIIRIVCYIFHWTILHRKKHSVDVAVKVPLMLVLYGKYCMRVWSRGKYPLNHALVQYFS